jgi:LPXTG-motif cell wall-anchored protein
MARKLVGIGAAATALGLAVALTSSPALAAVDDGTWGIWAAADVTDAPVGTIGFGSTTVPSASYEYTVISGDSSVEIATVNDKEMWVAASSAPGAVFGANGPSDIENLLDYDANEASETTLVITFDAEVPANELGFVIMDIDGSNSGLAEDADRFTVEATNAAGTSLTSSELNGGVFNFCNVPVAEMPGDCGGTAYTGVPTVTEPTATSVFFQADLLNSTDDGDSGWVNPTAAVKTMTVTWLSQDGGSSAKLAIAIAEKKVELPDTGIDLTTGALSALVLGVLGAVALIATRRRNA